jgi:hypothetical protein
VLDGEGGRLRQGLRVAVRAGSQRRRDAAALAAVLVRDNAPELRLVRAWLDSWPGLGLINLRHNAPGVGRITTSASPDTIDPRGPKQ